ALVRFFDRYSRMNASTSSRFCSILIWGLRPQTPYARRSRGPQGPAPLARLPRCARSLLRSLFPNECQHLIAFLFHLDLGTSSPDPLRAALAGAPRPRSACAAPSLRSFASSIAIPE